MRESNAQPEGYAAVWSELPTLLFISLTKGKFAVIDQVDAHLTRFKWTYLTSGGYVIRCPRKNEISDTSLVYLHRAVCPPIKGNVVDHINRTGTDNRRKNLRGVTQRQNLFNRGCTGKSGFKGVYKDSKSPGFNAVMRIGERVTHLGYFSEKEMAAAHYDLNALKHRGDLAVLNFPDRRPEYLKQIEQEQLTA